MSKKYKKYDAKIKAEVALKAIQGKASDLEICSEYDVPKANVHEWKNRLIDSAASLFITEDVHTRENKKLRSQLEELHKLIGSMTIENNFLKKKLQH